MKTYHKYNRIPRPFISAHNTQRTLDENPIKADIRRQNTLSHACVFLAISIAPEDELLALCFSLILNHFPFL